MLIPFGILSSAGGVGEVGDYELIATEILTASTPSVTFSSLATHASTYKHLQIRVVSRADADAGSNIVRFNGDTGANYSTHRLFTTGASVVSDAFINHTFVWAGANATNASTANSFAASVVDILDPFSTTKNTTTRTLGGRTSANFLCLLSGVYRNTDGVTSVLVGPNTGNYVAGSRVSLYGIRG